MSQPSSDAKAVVRAVEALTTQVRRAIDTLTTTAAQAVADASSATQTDYALAPTPPDDDATTPATTCSARYTGGLPVGDCIRAAGHTPDIDHTDDSGRHFGDASAEYPIADSTMKVSHVFPMSEQQFEEMNERARQVSHWITRGTRDLSIPEGPPCIPDHSVPVPCPGCEHEQAPAADEDAQRTARRDSLRNLLARLDRDGILVIGERMLLREHVEAEMREGDQWRAGRNTMKQRGEEIEQDRDRLAAELEEARTVLKYEYKRANDAIDREEAAEQAAEEQRRSADIFETELRVLREGPRANGADPTQIQNLWAQIRMRNRQWREEKRERAETQAAIDRVRALADQWDNALAPARSQYSGPVRAALDGTEQPTTEGN